MKSKISGGKNVVVKVLPSEVKHLRDEEVVIVSRAQLNVQLAFMSMDASSEEQVKKIHIVRSAINDMMEQEKKRKTVAIGAMMKVSDVKRVFSKIEDMPQNSFVQIKA